MTAPQQATPCAPWWRHGHVWLLLAGPVAVVVAGLWTAWLALQGSDPLVATDYYRRGIEINRTLQDQARGGAADANPGAQAFATLPAVQGRNHAATPARTVP